MKILLLSILLLPVSLNSSAQQAVSPPQPLCTSGVAPSERKILDGDLMVRQLGSEVTAAVRFVIADEAAFKDEKHRVETLQANVIAIAPNGSAERERAIHAPNFIVAHFGDVLFELVETNHTRIAAVYLNETASCHDKSNNFDVYGCVGVSEYAMGFIEGTTAGSANVLNFNIAGH
jgi:hypothetical protein